MLESTEKNDKTESQQTHMEELQVSEEASPEQLNLSLETSYTEYIALPKITETTKTLSDDTKVQLSSDFINEIKSIDENLEKKEDEALSEITTECDSLPKPLKTVNTSSHVTSFSKIQQPPDFVNEVENSGEKADRDEDEYSDHDKISNEYSDHEVKNKFQFLTLSPRKLALRFTLLIIIGNAEQK